LYVAHKFRAALAGKKGQMGEIEGPGKLIFILWQTGQHGKWGDAGKWRKVPAQRRAANYKSRM